MDVFKPMDSNQAKEALGLDAGKKYVLFPSEPSRVGKRYEIAVAALEAYRAGGREAELLCLDNVPHEKVPIYMNAADALLMTSEFEASPVTVREALACNLPVLSTRVGDVESVLDGIEGCYVVEPDAHDIADKLGRTLQSEKPFMGREKMADYSLQNTALKIIKIYEQLRGATDDE
jgi:glycosyltransferase involved in cell wall biosynthesis